MGLDTVLEKLSREGVAPDRADDLAQLAFMEWMGALPAGSDFRATARAALEVAAEAEAEAGLAAPAITAFRALVTQALNVMPAPVSLALPAPVRRGGRATRRLTS